MDIDLDVMLDKKSLNSFLIYHNYARPAGLCGIIISVAAVVVMFVKWDYWSTTQKGILVLLALLFTVIQPLMLVSKGKKQLMLEEFQIPFHYIFSENGVEISQKDQTQKFTWREVRKVIYRKDAMYVYMSNVSAFVLPASECKGQFDELAQMMKEHTKK